MINTQKILIFAGVDNTGKTTISKKLSEILLIPYFKNSTEKRFFFDNDVAKYRWLDQLYLHEFLKQTKYSIILDRAYPCDIVYSSVFRKQNKESISYLYQIDERFAKINAKIIYCYKTNNIKSDDIINIEKYQDIEREYASFLSKTMCEFLKLNTSDEKLDEQIGEIIKWQQI